MRNPWPTTSRDGLQPNHQFDNYCRLSKKSRPVRPPAAKVGRASCDEREWEVKEIKGFPIHFERDLSLGQLNPQAQCARGGAIPPNEKNTPSCGQASPCAKHRVREKGRNPRKRIRKRQILRLCLIHSSQCWGRKKRGMEDATLGGGGEWEKNT